MQSSADKLITNIVGFSQEHGDLLNKFNLDFYLHYFDRNAIVAMGDQLHPHQELTQEQFLRIFLLKINHAEEETLYWALSLRRLFHSILERTTAVSTIQFSDFTSYLCEVRIKICRKYLNRIWILSYLRNEQLKKGFLRKVIVFDKLIFPHLLY